MKNKTLKNNKLIQLVYSLISTGMMLIYLIVTTVTIINTCYPSVLTISDAVSFIKVHVSKIWFAVFPNEKE